MRRIVAGPREHTPEIPIIDVTVIRDPVTLAGTYIGDNGSPIGAVTCLKCAEPECMVGTESPSSSASICPVNALTPPSNGLPIQIGDSCIGCGLCVIRCPIGAIALTDTGVKAEIQRVAETVVVTADEQQTWFLATRNSFQDISSTALDKVALRLTSRAATLRGQHFYPLVAALFRAMGIPAYAADLGVNNERIDVMLSDSNVPIPAEVKSATEVSVINAKSIQQALENKLALARNMGCETLPEGSSLAIGSEHAPERSGLYEAIDDIRRAFGVEIATVTTLRLFRLALEATKTGPIDRNLFARARGKV